MVIGFAAYGGILFVVALVSRGMGMGDVKLAALIGLVLGALSLGQVAVAAGAAIVSGRSAPSSRSLAGPAGRVRSPSARSWQPAPSWRRSGDRRSPSGTSGRSCTSDLSARIQPRRVEHPFVPAEMSLWGV
jgi:hypothetical protein